MMPKTTMFSPRARIDRAEALVDGLRQSIRSPLILTFSHPGEGTLERYVTAIAKRSTKNQTTASVGGDCMAPCRGPPICPHVSLEAGGLTLTHSPRYARKGADNETIC